MGEGGFNKIDVLGSLRRKAPTVGDVDLAAASDNPKAVITRFVEYPNKVRVINQGEKSVSILLPPNIRADLKVESSKTYGALLQHFTGSKHHNVALREYSLKKGMSLSEHGIKIKGKLNFVADEKDFYKRLEMDWIPPEIREGGDEIEAAINHKLPELVELGDIKGDLQIHSDFDIETSHDVGASSMEEVVQKAGELNYEYIAFTEHNPSQKGHSQTQILELLKRKRDKITQLNDNVKAMKTSIQKVFNSLEVDMTPSGQLPVDDDGLEMLDFALVSIHSSFKLSRKDMTERVLRGLDHPKVKIFAHPTARLLEKREGVELDWDKIFDFCLKNNKWIEINADPHRLDLPDFLIREAVKYGVKLSLGTDSHHKDGLNNMRYGVAMARRGWAEKKNIINTMPLSELEKLL
jgi:DNA polymerase (family 10)